MQWLRFFGGKGRRKSPFNNVDASGQLSCGRVTPQLLIGGELGPCDWLLLQKAGVSAVINMQQEQQDVWAPNERIDGYLWLPSPDGLAPSVAQLTQGVTFIAATIDSGLSVFVHCKAGQGRAPLLCACYLITLGATPLEAVTRVRQARPRTLLTPDQNARLREFALQQQALAQRNTGGNSAALPGTLSGNSTNVAKPSNGAAIARPSSQKPASHPL